jgi:hypothetical protein
MVMSLNEEQSSAMLSLFLLQKKYAVSITKLLALLTVMK